MELSICLKALGDPTRLTIFQQLLIRKHCTRSLSRKLGISEPAISQHLKILHEAGMVYKEKYGYHMHYLPTQEAMDFLAVSFEQMRQASLAVDRNPRGCQCEFRRLREDEISKENAKKEIDVMRIAVTYENGQVFQHFGHTEQFKLYDVKDGVVTASKVVSAEGFGHGALAGFLRQCQADAVICGGIGGGAQSALAEAGIRLYAGIQGDADEAVAKLIAGTLAYEENPVCDHHGEHHHHGEDHGEHCDHEGHCCH